MSFYRQIREQPRRLRALAEDLARTDHALRSATCGRMLGGKLVLTGMGSSLYACYPAYLRMVQAGLPVSLWETAELVHYGRGTIDAGTAMVAVSQSGETAEILALLERLPREQQVLGVTNVAESTLGRRADLALAIGAEHSRYASSQTYVNSLALLLAVAHAAQKEPFEPLVAKILEAAGALEALLMESFARSDVELDRGRHLVFLARGPSWASAQQGALMFHEVAGRGAAAMSAAAFRHGPLEMAGPGLEAVVMLPHGPAAGLLENLAKDLERFGARVIRIADSRLEAGEFRHAPVVEALAPAVNIAPVQAMTYRAAVAAGREPGVFRQMESVTRVE